MHMDSSLCARTAAAALVSRLPARRGQNKKVAATQDHPTSISSEKDEKLTAFNAPGVRRTGAAGPGAASRQQALALRALAGQLAGAANGFRLLACPLLRRLLVMSAHLHFAENAFALHLLLERAKRLINIVVADEYLHVLSCR